MFFDIECCLIENLSASFMNNSGKWLLRHPVAKGSARCAVVLSLGRLRGVSGPRESARRIERQLS